MVKWSTLVSIERSRGFKSFDVCKPRVPSSYAPLFLIQGVLQSNYVMHSITSTK